MVNAMAQPQENTIQTTKATLSTSPIVNLYIVIRST